MTGAFVALAAVFLAFASSSDAIQKLDISASALTRRALRQASYGQTHGDAPDPDGVPVGERRAALYQRPPPLPLSPCGGWQ